MGRSPFGANTNKKAASAKADPSGSAPQKSSEKPGHIANRAPMESRKKKMDRIKGKAKAKTRKFTSYGKPKQLVPRVQLEKYKKIFREASLHRESLQKQIRKLVRKTKTGLTYFEVLSLYQKTEPSDQAVFRALVEAKAEIIQKLGIYDRLKNDTATLKETSKLLDVEIDFWGGVAETRSKFITPKDGTVRIKALRPNKTVVHVLDRGKKKAPTILGGRPKSKPVTLDTRGRAQLGEDEAELETEAKETEKLQAKALKREGALRAAAEKNVVIKAKYYGSNPKKVKDFISKLPSKYAWREAIRKARRPAEIRSESQSYISETQRIKWDIGKLIEELKKRDSDYGRVAKRLQTKMQLVVDQHKNNAQVVTALGILVNLRPERFLTSANLEEALRSALSSSTISTLSGFGGSSSKSAVAEVNTLLRKQASESEALMAETAIKSTALDIVKAEAKGEVPPLRHPELPDPGTTDNILPILLILAGVVIAIATLGGK